MLESKTISLLPFMEAGRIEAAFVKDAEKKMKGINNDVLESDDTLIEESDADESESDPF